MSEAGSSRPRYNVLIRPAEPSDLPACAECWGLRRDTYPSIYPQRLSKDIPHSVRMQRNVDELAQELGDCSKKAFFVATPPDDPSHVVGFVIWQKPAPPSNSGKQPAMQTAVPVIGSEPDPARAPDPDADPERDHELAAKLQAESTEVKARFAKGKRMWFLSMLFIDPAYQRQGVGTAMLEHGLDMILRDANDAAGCQDRTGQEPLLIGLTSSPQGVKLYERFGFRSVYWFRPDVMDLDAEGKLVKKEISWPLMIREG